MYYYVVVSGDTFCCCLFLSFLRLLGFNRCAKTDIYEDSIVKTLALLFAELFWFTGEIRIFVFFRFYDFNTFVLVHERI